MKTNRRHLENTTEIMRKTMRNSIPKRYRFQNMATALLLICLIILPLIVHYKSFEIKGSFLLYIPTTNGEVNDLAIYYKSILFVTAVLLLTAYFLGERIIPDRKIASPLFTNEGNRIFIYLALCYILLAAFSMALSKNISAAWYGLPNSFEGTPVLVCYLLVFLLSINYFSDGFNVSVILKAFPFLCGFIAIFGLVEVFYKSPYNIPAFQYLILPASLWKSVGGLAAAQYKGRISLTFANPDYAGEFLAMVLPVSFYCIKNNSGRRKLLSAALSAVLIFLLVCTASRAAIIVFVLCLAALATAYKEEAFRAWKTIMSVFGLVLILVLCAALVHKISIPSLHGQSRTAASAGAQYHVDDIRIEKNSVYFQNDKTCFEINVSEKGFSFYDGNERATAADKSGGTFTFRDARYKAIRVTLKKDTFFVDLGYQEPVEFMYRRGNVYAVGTNGSLLNDVSDSTGFGPKQWQSFATGRGYIWRKTLPLLAETVAVGFGADCFIFHIPQNDYAGKLNYQGTATLVIDKPHSFYLQTATNTGILSLIALGALFFIYGFRTFRRLKVMRENKTSAYDLTVAVITGVAAYLLCGFFYDSSVTVAPVFWCMFGLGVALCGKPYFDIVHPAKEALHKK